MLFITPATHPGYIIMIQRRERFLQEIRRREREALKSEIRLKVLAEISQAAAQQQALNEEYWEVFSLFVEQEEEGGCSRELLEFSRSLGELLEEWLGGCGWSRASTSPLWFVVEFTQNLVQNNNGLNVQRALECLEQALDIKERYFAFIRGKRMEVFEAEIIIKWESAFSILLLLIFHTAPHHTLAPLTAERLNFCFSEWIERTCIALEVLSLQNIDFNNFHHERIVQSLKEILAFMRLKHSSTAPLIRILDERMVQAIQKCFGSYKTDPSVKMLVSEINLKIVKTELKEAFGYIMESDFCNTLRYMIAFEMQLGSSKRDSEQIAREQMLQNILEFILEGSYLCFSDKFWDKGVCCELREALRFPIRNKALREDIIVTLLVCTTTITLQATLELISEQQTFEWVLQVLRECIELRVTDLSLTDLILNAILTLRMFVQLGEQQKVKDNPYIVKLRYACGIEILGKCSEGVEFLEEIGCADEEA